MQTESDRMFLHIREWRDRGLGVALATVVKTWGSAHQRPGSQLAVASGGQSVGGVCSGCIEGELIEHASAVMSGGGARLVSFDVSDPQAWQRGLACGGHIEVFVESVE